MLNAIYKLPKLLLVSLLIGGGIVFILVNDPPHTLCDSQIEQFQQVQTGRLYSDPRDFRKEKSALKRGQQTCREEGAPGSCYEYFSQLKQLLRDFRVLSPECNSLIYARSEIKEALSSALALMTALAWREEALSGRVSKYNWLSRADMILFCDIKNKYSLHYGGEAYKALESQILNLLPLEKKVSPVLLLKRTILSESCAVYRM